MIWIVIWTQTKNIIWIYLFTHLLTHLFTHLFIYALVEVCALYVLLFKMLSSRSCYKTMCKEYNSLQFFSCICTPPNTLKYIFFVKCITLCYVTANIYVYIYTNCRVKQSLTTFGLTHTINLFLYQKSFEESIQTFDTVQVKCYSKNYKNEFHVFHDTT